MSEVKALIEEFAIEKMALQQQLDRMAIELTMLTIEFGKVDKRGRVVVRVPAKARKRAQGFDVFDDRFGGGNDPTKGALSITAHPRKVVDDG